MQQFCIFPSGTLFGTTKLDYARSGMKLWGWDMRSFQIGLLISAAWFGSALAFEPAKAVELNVPIQAAPLSEHIRILSSDAFEGRGPATEGEKKSIAYISEQMKAIGLMPGAKDGGWTQPVKLNRFAISRPVKAAITLADWNRPLIDGEDVVIGSRRMGKQVKIDQAPLVFVGYGVHAPERGWDDFKGIDLRGKIMVVLVNDPDFETVGPGAFEGKAMTYYGRWTYKFEEAARQGALGVLVVHETPSAGYGWATVRNSWTSDQFDILHNDPKATALMEGWIQRSVAVDLFRQAGQDFEQLKAKAQTKDFKPVALGGATLSTSFAVKAETITSYNVIGRLPGKTHPDQTILYTAHWDHLGRGRPDAKGDDIYNGALDNASGVAGLLALAFKFKAAGQTERSVVFMAVTAEEKGLLGSEYYAANPVYPLSKTVVNLNMDGLPMNGRTRDVIVVGAGKGTIEDDLAKAAADQGRTIAIDPVPEAGHYYRSDHFPFAKRGVPALHAGAGEDLVNGGREAGEAARKDYIVNRYHQPADEWKPDWDYSGAIEDLELLYKLGDDLARSDRWPEWKQGAEFKAIRDASAKDRR
jgi:Zn-dependent M28 family amino/carboxypeptidase